MDFILVVIRLLAIAAMVTAVVKFSKQGRLNQPLGSKKNSRKRR